MHIHLTLDREVVSKTRELAGLVPFSRFVEDLLRKEIGRQSRESR